MRLSVRLLIAVSAIAPVVFSLELVGCGTDGAGNDLAGAPTTDSGSNNNNNNNNDAASTDGSNNTNTNQDSGNNNGNDGGGNGGSADGGTEGGPGGSTTTLSCGSATCSLPSQICCVANPPGPGSFTFGCVTGAACPVDNGDAGNNGDPPLALKCSSAANCSQGTVCCMTKDNNDQVTSECKATCSGGGNNGQLCDKNASTQTNGCAAGVACSSNNINDWGLPSTFATCGGVGN